MAEQIVIVDDDENLMRLLVALFESQGYAVVSFFKGKEATDYLSDEKNLSSVRLLILDRMLPDMDGIEILRFFLQKYSTKIPVLILSFLSAEKDVVEGLQIGAVDYISKPFSMNILVQKAKKLIAGK